MLPIYALMQERRLIERMFPLMRKELLRIKETKEVNSRFIDLAVDFIRAYADRCHHGKEEGILFKELTNKPLSNEHAAVMKSLIEEHVYARKTTGSLEKAIENYRNGNKEAGTDVWKFLNELADFYPKHIEKEDKRFFYPAMEYFSQQEQDVMLDGFWNFDRRLIHERYVKVLGELERLAATKL